MKKGDMIVIGAILIIGLAIWGVNSLLASWGNQLEVVIKSEGTELTRMEVDATTSASYTVKNQFGTNRILIDKGAVSMHQASCKNQLCVNHDPILKNGQSIVCLPNRVIIEIKAKGSTKDQEPVDAISH